MAQTFDCPSCGATLDYTGDEPIVRCSYCGRTIMVPESLRPAPQPAWTAAPISGSVAGVDLGGLIGMAQQLGEVKQLARSGQHAAAAQRYQEITGASAEEAGQVVQRLAAGQSVVISSTTASTSFPAVSDVRVEVSVPQVAQMLAAQQGAAPQEQQRTRWAVLWVAIGAAVLLSAILVVILLLLGK